MELEALAAAQLAAPEPLDARALALAAAAHPLLASPCSDALGRALRWACALFARPLPAHPQLPLGLRWRVASAHPLDVQALHGFVTELAVFEDGLAQVATTPATFLRDGFGAAQAFHALLLEGAEGAPLGMALLHASYSTWQGRTLYLEDLYLQPAARGLGAARRVLALLAAAALAAGAARLQWCCLTWNEGAQRVYGGVRAEVLEEWQLWRLERRGLEEVACGASTPAAPSASAHSRNE